MIEWLQDWYSSNCNGEWEHENVVKIQSLDNPGWLLEINIVNLAAKAELKNWNVFEISEQNWIGYDVEDNKFTASGDSTKLEALIMIFKIILENGEIDDKYIYEHFLS